jgi:hypothetical protein
VIYSSVLEMECPIPEICTAAGLPANSTLGQVIMSLMDEVERLRSSAGPGTGSRPVPKVTADSILRQLTMEQLFCCDKCFDRINAMLKRWRISGVLQHEEEVTEEERRSIKKMEEKLLQ